MMAVLSLSPGAANARAILSNEEPETISDVTGGCPNSDQILRGHLETREQTAMVGLFPCWDADESNNSYRFLSDLYAHWSVREIRGASAMQRDYARERRPAVLRFFVGRNLSLVSSVRIDLRDPDMTFVIPLASFSYQGRVGKGEAWSTDLVADDQTQPFFRIGPTTSAKINVSAKSSTELEVKAAGSILNALRDLTAVVSPGASLITTLNRESLQQTSNALDNALSSIWSESKDESQVSGRQLSEWYQGSSFIIQLEIPAFVKTKTSDNLENPRKTTTRWYYLTLSCPRYSIFDSRHACVDREDTAADDKAGMLSPNFQTRVANLPRRVTAQQVNNFKLASGKTLQQYLSDQDWYARFLRRGDAAPGNQPQKDTSAAPPLAPPNPAPNPAPPGVPVAPAPAYGATSTQPRTENDYAALCNSIVDSLYAVGLSSLDARIGLWAIVTGSPDFVGIEAGFQSNPRCPQLLPVGWYFSQTPATAAATAKPARARRKKK